jgi:hypothetical protein
MNNYVQLILLVLSSLLALYGGRFIISTGITDIELQVL